MAAEEASPAIVLRARDYGEADRIVTLLTRDAGKLGAIAKGVRKSRGRFERRLEPFSHVIAYFRRRANAELVFLTRAEAHDLPQPNPAEGLENFALGSYALELVDAVVKEGMESRGAYQRLLEMLVVLSQAQATVALRQAFELAILSWAGYRLDFGRCCQCARRVGELSEELAFLPERGGVCCNPCRHRTGGGGRILSVASVRALDSLSALSFGDAVGARAAGPDGTNAVTGFVVDLLGRRLRSLAFLDAVMGDGNYR